MKINIICKTDDYDRFKKLFEKNGFEVTDDIARYKFEETGFNSNKIIGYDYNGNKIIVEIDNIILLETNVNRTGVKLDSGDICFAREKLYHFEVKQYKDVFVRVNKSQVINLTKIKKVSPQFNSRLKLILSNGEVVYVSRTYIRKFRELFL